MTCEPSRLGEGYLISLAPSMPATIAEARVIIREIQIVFLGTLEIRVAIFEHRRLQ